MVTIKVSNRALYTFIAIALVVLVSGVAFAYNVGLGSVPSPGHSLDSIQGLFSGDANLQDTLNKFCQSDGTNCYGSSYYIWRKATKTGDYIDCKSTCTGAIVLGETDPKCSYYTDGYATSFTYCNSGYVKCGYNHADKLTCAKKKTIDSTQIGEILIK